MLHVAVQNALKLLQGSQGVIKQFTPQASGALDKLITLFHPDTLKIGSDTASATLTAGNSAAIATARQLRLDPKHMQDCLSGLYGHINPQDWTQLNELFGLIQGRENALEILGDDGLKAINKYFSNLKQNPLAIVDNVLGEAGSTLAFTSDPEKAVFNSMVRILKAKTENTSGHVHNLQKALKFLGIDFNLTDYVAKKIIENKDFEGCLKAYIRGEEPNSQLLGGFWQRQAFSYCKKMLDSVRDNPNLILEKGPQTAYWMRYTSGPIMLFLNRIPIIGKLLCVLFPFATDVVGSTGEKYVQEELKTIFNVLNQNKASRGIAGDTLKVASGLGEPQTLSFEAAKAAQEAEEAARKLKKKAS